MCMTPRKERLAVTVDRTALDAVTDSVAKKRRLAAMRDAVLQYEAEFGVITERELANQARSDGANARSIPESA